VEVVSQPRIAMLNNTVANIQVGQTRSYVESSNIETTQSGGTIVSGSLGEVHGGVTLQIVGNMVGDEIFLNVTPVVSSVDDIRSIALGGGSRLEAPETSMKSMNTMVRLKERETVVIGGLITKNSAKQHFGIPILGRLPLLGRLFSYESVKRSRVELVVLITPRRG
jgi:type II secretory pathway component GspD/PulD (secretin)